MALSLPITPLLGLRMNNDSNIIFGGASAVHLHKLDTVQKAAEKPCQTTHTYISVLTILLQGQCHWPAAQAAGFPLSTTTPGFLPCPFLCCTSLPSAICRWQSFAAPKFCEVQLTGFIYIVFWA